ncbi:hypothetical protein DIPPA_02800 [Diplonema papillatum]|nr:hypothetical protein DIPPA_02800 [Diplonema papillatum]
MLLTAEEIEKLNSFDRRKPKPKPKRRRVPEPVVPAPEPKGKRKRAAEEEEADPPPQKKKPRPASEDTPSQQVTSLIREQGKLAKELATKKRKERQLQKEITDLEAAQNRVLAQRRTLQKQSKRGPAKKAAAAAQPAPKAGRPRSPPQAKAAKKPAPKKKGAKVLQAEAQPAVPALIPGISVDAILAHYALDDLRRFAAKHDFALEVREKRKAPLANDIHTFLATGNLWLSGL